MADFNQTISNSIRAHGPSVASLWGVMVWGVDCWGDSKDTRVDAGKWLFETMLVSSDVSKKAMRHFNNSFSVSNILNLVSLTDGRGYTYVMQGGATDPDNRVFPSYTADSLDASVYTKDTISPTVWSEA